MGKREKREKRRKERLDKASEIRLGAVDVTCPACGNRVHILPINMWAGCGCGQTVYRSNYK